MCGDSSSGKRLIGNFFANSVLCKFISPQPTQQNIFEEKSVMIHDLQNGYVQGRINEKKPTTRKVSNPQPLGLLFRYATTTALENDNVVAETPASKARS